MSEETKTQTFDCWCIIELMGHQKIAGRVTEQQLGGTSFIRVDVPETKTAPAFTRLLNHPAIYAINPVDEQTAINTAQNLQVAPISQYEANEMAKQKATELLNDLKEKNPELKELLDKIESEKKERMKQLNSWNEENNDDNEF